MSEVILLEAAIQFNPFNFLPPIVSIVGANNCFVTLYLQQYFLVLYPLSTLYKCEGYNNNQHLYALGSNKCVFQQITTLWFHFIYFLLFLWVSSFFRVFWLYFCNIFVKSQAKAAKNFHFIFMAHKLWNWNYSRCFNFLFAQLGTSKLHILKWAFCWKFDCFRIVLLKIIKFLS